MKKSCFGCFFTGLLLIAVGSIAVYFLAIKPLVSTSLGGIANLVDQAEENEAIENKEPFVAPEDGELTYDQVRDYMAVRNHMISEMGHQLDAFKERYEHLYANRDQQGELSGLGEVVGAFRDLMTLLPEAKELQVEALNLRGLSLEEYKWVKGEMYRAAGIALPQLGTKEILEMAREGAANPESLQERFQVDMSEVPEKNQELVKSHARKLKESIWLAWLGL